MNTHVRDNMKARAPVHYSEITSSVTITATTSGTPTSVIAGSAITYEARPVLIEFWALRLTDNGGSGDSYLGLYDGSTLVSQIVWCSNASSVPVYAAHRLTPSAASHTYNVQGWSPTGASATLTAGTGASGTNAPAFLRITYDEV